MSHKPGPPWHSTSGCPAPLRCAHSRLPSSARTDSLMTTVSLTRTGLGQATPGRGIDRLHLGAHRLG